MTRFEQLVESLENDRYVFIEIYDMTHSRYVGHKLFAEDLKKNHATIKDYFAALHNEQGIRQIQIQEYRKNGNSRKILKPSFQLNLESSQPVNQRQEQMALPPQPSQQHQAVVMPGMTGLNGLGLDGLGVAKLVGVQERYDRLKIDYDELRNRLMTVENKKERLETDLKAELRKIEVELKEAKVALATAEQKKDLAVKEVELKQKSFFDSELAKKLPDTLSGFMSQQQPQVQEVVPQGLAGATEIKQNLIDLVISEKFTDQMAQETLFTATGIYTNAEFLGELRSLIKKYQLHAH